MDLDALGLKRVKVWSKNRYCRIWGNLSEEWKTEGKWRGTGSGGIYYFFHIPLAFPLNKSS